MTFEEMFRAAYAFTAPSIEIGHVLNARQAREPSLSRSYEVCSGCCAAAEALAARIAGSVVAPALSRSLSGELP